jgi:hypothetical protein
LLLTDLSQSLGDGWWGRHAGRLARWPDRDFTFPQRVVSGAMVSQPLTIRPVRRRRSLDECGVKCRGNRASSTSYSP